MNAEWYAVHCNCRHFYTRVQLKATFRCMVEGSGAEKLMNLILTRQAKWMGTVTVLMAGAVAHVIADCIRDSQEMCLRGLNAGDKTGHQYTSVSKVML